MLISFYPLSCLLIQLLSFVCLFCTHRRAYCYSCFFVCFVRTGVLIIATLVRLFVLYAPACLLPLSFVYLFCTHRRAYYCYSRSFVCVVRRTGVLIATLVRLFVLYAPVCLLLLSLVLCTHRRAYYCYSRSFVCVRTDVLIATLVCLFVCRSGSAPSRADGEWPRRRGLTRTNASFVHLLFIS